MNCHNLTHINIEGDAKELIHMNEVFYNCRKLINVDISNLALSSVKYMNMLFAGCKSLTNVKIGIVNDVIDTNNMFADCISLKEIDLSQLNPTMILNTSYMFYNCKSLEKIEFPHRSWQIKYMMNMFYNCKHLTDLDLSSFKFSTTEDMTRLFYGCKRLETLNIPNSPTFTTTADFMFEGCESLKKLKISKSMSNNSIDMLSMRLNNERIIDTDIPMSIVEFI